MLRDVFVAGPALTRRVANVYHAECGDGLDAVVALGGSNGVSAACADANDADFVCVDAVKALQVADHGVDVADALVWVFEEVWLAAAGALEGGVVGYGGEAGVG